MATARTETWDARDAAAMLALLRRQRAAFTAELPVSAAVRKDRLRRAADVPSSAPKTSSPPRCPRISATARRRCR